ncbi:hypothetical protein SmJEL517_g04930 [Synchytrium microbalum]|uniref:Fe2OG dioxygenase domain-containing protein n=1 Tax=Synchytrium microbalum TaxID=1806994 RepID=A0A507BXH4_9FUNG|nr:uncharacterized protein SmJEL517_g04930 [Synchytrium microbalum]TPX31838.1 hypothetical protein SmJEL517_g04930 [Synchytrium microbalum]
MAKSTTKKAKSALEVAPPTKTVDNDEQVVVNEEQVASTTRTSPNGPQADATTQTPTNQERSWEFEECIVISRNFIPENKTIMPLIAATAALPIVDISPFLPNASLEDKARKPIIAKEMFHACRDVGFMYICGHGIDSKVVNGVQDYAREFFGLPTEEKEKIHISNSDMARGYQMLGQNITKYKKDWHEGIDSYAELSPDHTLNKMGIKTLTGKNQWPAQPAGFKNAYLDYVEQCKVLGMAIMQAMAMSLGLDEHYFDKIMTDSFWCMRIIGYPPLTEGLAKDGEVGMSCGEHCDYGCLTILNTDSTTGALQVLSKEGEWIDANPVPGCFVINIGDMLNNLTNDIVIHTKSSYRVSIPFFFEPHFDALIEPIPKCVKETDGIPHHKPVIYGNHLLSKVSNNFDVSAAGSASL